MFRIAEFTCFPHKIESDFARTGQTTLNWNSSLLDNIMNRTHPGAFLLVHWELFLLHRLQLVPEVELGSLVKKIRWSPLSKDYCKPSSAAWRTCSRTWKPFSVSAWCCNCQVVIYVLGIKNGLFDRNAVEKFTYNFPLRSLTAMLSSLIWRKQF